MLAELAEHGYARLTVEGVAVRARTGKASIYRRWPARADLVREAIAFVLDSAIEPPDTGGFRDDVLRLCLDVAELLAGVTGEVMRGLVGDGRRDLDRTDEVRRLVLGLGMNAMRDVTGRAVARGEIGSESITPNRLSAGPTLIYAHFLFGAKAPAEELVTQLVDEVIIPLFRAGS
ncbi:TetR/AcrR family transcriptional regulator [Nonomuraea sp. B10E15]|uniref:TetR/AcrR family transcriptional regulator n=1 Tax=unclassified Nonomuraea TaxID=2593643 RepID=UPI00325E2958